MKSSLGAKLYHGFKNQNERLPQILPKNDIEKILQGAQKLRPGLSHEVGALSRRMSYYIDQLTYVHEILFRKL